MAGILLAAPVLAVAFHRASRVWTEEWWDSHIPNLKNLSSGRMSVTVEESDSFCQDTRAFNDRRVRGGDEKEEQGERSEDGLSGAKNSHLGSSGDRRGRWRARPCPA